MANHSLQKFQPIIGLEVHVELATVSKMFCGCPSDHFGVKPNTHTCPVCLGLPGALPVPNRKAVDWTILLGLALNCHINTHSKFDRKNYFYPDLPKGYQITQYDEPIAINGELKIKGQNLKEKVIRVRRVHLEEDTGKLQHATLNGQDVTLVDFNRSGVPLVEIVTDPDFRSVDEVDQYLKKLQKIIRCLGISGADMEKGSMRLEPSISISPSLKPLQGQTLQSPLQLPPYRVELKNINSFRFARKALEFEIDRQTKLLEKGQTPTQQTRGWSQSKNATFPQREKEEAHDYRYFPEPDIPPMHFSDELVESLRQQIPELPDAKSARYQADFGLTEYTSNILAEDKDTAKYFEEAVKISLTEKLSPPASITDIANWIVNKKIDITNLIPAQLVQQIAKSKQTSQVNEADLEKAITQVLAENPKAIVDFKSGNSNVLGFLLSKVKQHSKADPSTIIKLLSDKISQPQ